MLFRPHLKYKVEIEKQYVLEFTATQRNGSSDQCVVSWQVTAEKVCFCASMLTCSWRLQLLKAKRTVGSSCSWSVSSYIHCCYLCVLSILQSLCSKFLVIKTGRMSLRTCRVNIVKSPRLRMACRFYGSGEQTSRECNFELSAHVPRGSTPNSPVGEMTHPDQGACWLSSHLIQTAETMSSWYCLLLGHCVIISQLISLSVFLCLCLFFHTVSEQFKRLLSLLLNWKNTNIYIWRCGPR